MVQPLQGGRLEAAQRVQPPADLSHLIHPVSTAEFMRDYWEKKPLVVTRQDPGYYAELLSLQDVDHILTTSSVRNANLRVMHQGKETPISELLDGEPGGGIGGLEALYARYRQGSTIVLNALHERWEHLAALCRSLASELTATFQVNVYLTPRGARGLRTHYDTHDVFVLQVEGTKHWRIFDAPAHLPLANQPFVEEKHAPTGEPIYDFDLQPGDLIYIPRGFTHDATSNEVASLHLTVGVLPVLWTSVFRSAVSSVIEADPRFRESLPPGFARNAGLQREAEKRFTDLLEVLRAGLSAEPAVAGAVTRALLGRHPVLEGHLLDLEEEITVTPTTRVHRRPGIQYRLARQNGHVSLEFHGKTVKLPGHVEDDVRYVTEAATFTAANLPGRLDEPGRVVLVRTLLREGFLTSDRSQ
jgi:ribosomal protein L16 Arg81 hydroxylase